MDYDETTAQLLRENKQLRELLYLLEEAREYFGPCWCKQSIGYECPQCDWEERYTKLVDGVIG